MEEYQRFLRNLDHGNLTLPNRNLDTGTITPPGAYFMQDGAYAKLLHQVAARQFKDVSPEVRQDILVHLAGLSQSSRIKRDKLDKAKVEWARIPQELYALETSR